MRNWNILTVECFINSSQIYLNPDINQKEADYQNAVSSERMYFLQSQSSKQIKTVFKKY